jgi:hypothetical protein
MPTCLMVVWPPKALQTDVSNRHAFCLSKMRARLPRR